MIKRWGKLWVWWNHKFVSEISFSENCRFDSCSDLINPKLGQNGSKLVIHVPIVTERWKSMVKINWSKVFLLKPLSQNLEVLTLCCEIINLKISQKGPNWYFMYQCWLIDQNQKRKVLLRWVIPLWNSALKILKFWPNLVTSSTENWLEKRPKLVSHVLMVIERWESEVKGTLEWCIRLWNYLFFEILKF